MEVKKIFFDIETAVETEDYENYTKKDIWAEKYCNDIGNMTEKEAYFNKGSFNPEFSKIVCISVGLWSDIRSFYGNEKDILEDFFTYIESQGEHVLAGHNIISFDIPFVFRRALINGIKPPKSFIIGNVKPYEVPHIDIMKLWKQTGFISTGLDLMCRSLGIESPKSDISGKDVGRIYYESLGKKDADGAIDTSGIERIAKYCEADVVASMRVYEKITDIIGEDEVPQPQKATYSNLISEKQVGYAMSLWGKLNIEGSEEKRHKYLMDKYGVDSIKLLSKEQASEFIEDMKNEKIKEKLDTELGNDNGSKKKENDDLPF